MPPAEASVLREGCYSVCFLHVSIAALGMSFSVGGERQDPSIILIGQREFFILPWLEVCCVCSGELPKETLRSHSLMQVLRPSASSQLLTQQCPRSECAWSNRKDEQNKHMLCFSRDAKEDCGNLVSVWILSPWRVLSFNSSQL